MKVKPDNSYVNDSEEHTQKTLEDKKKENPHINQYILHHTCKGFTNTVNIMMVVVCCPGQGGVGVVANHSP